jgi:hypothetical protein
MKAEERAFYEGLLRASVEKLSALSATDQRFKIFAELMRLRRACCSAILAMPEDAREIGLEKNSPLRSWRHFPIS